MNVDTTHVAHETHTNVDRAPVDGDSLLHPTAPLTISWGPLEHLAV